MKQKNPLWGYRQHGWVPNLDRGDEVSGDCPFCGKESHFSISKDSLKFHCKRCGVGGGFKRFLKLTYERCLHLFRGDCAIRLSKDRGIPSEALRRAGVAYDPRTDQYLLPVRGDEDDFLHDLRMYKIGGAFRSTSGCHLRLMGWEGITEARGKVWICEGEWDWISWLDVLRSAGRKEDRAIALPGASSFKMEWSPFFVDKDVVSLYDNDEPGRMGAAKAHGVLSPAARTVSYLHWPKSLEEGYDIRDLYKESGRNAKIIWEKVSGNLKSEPPLPLSSPQRTATVTAASEKKLDGKGLPADKVYEGFRRWLHIPDETVIDVLFGTALANRLPGDPLWMMLVAVSGGMKTEPLMALVKGPKVMTVSSVTEAGLVSGAQFANGQDPSLLYRLMRPGELGRLLIIKDLTTVLSSPEYDRNKIFAILREAYDGLYEKQFGNGVFRRYIGHFGLIAAVTPKIEEIADTMGSMGERFLQFWLPSPKTVKDRREFVLRARANAGKELQLREDLAALGEAVLTYDYGEPPETPPEYESKIIDAAMVTETARGIVPRDRFTRDITGHEYAGMPTRIVKEFQKLVEGVGQFHRIKKIGPNEFRAVRQTAISSIPSAQRSVLRLLWRNLKKGRMTSEEIAEKIRLPKFPTVDRLLHNLGQLRIIDRINMKITRGGEWGIAEEWVEIIDNSELFSE